jgi:peptide deformylase
MLKIIHYPHQGLTKKARSVKQITPKIEKLAQDMLKTLVPNSKKPLGVGLAATQVNQMWRLFVMLMPDNQYQIIINPQIIKTSKKTLSSLPKDQQFLEGCLSIPGYYGFIDRPLKIKVRYQTITGLNQQKSLTPPHSAYFQHELDHLNGILFIDYLKKRNEPLYLADKNGQLNPIEFPFA